MMLDTMQYRGPEPVPNDKENLSNHDQPIMGIFGGPIV